MSELVPVAAIITSGVVGPSVLSYLAGRRERRRQKHESDQQSLRLAHDRELLDLAELRAVLDAAAQVVRLTMWKADRFTSFLEQHPRFSSRREQRDARDRLQALIDDMQQTSDEAALMSGRIALRLGKSHPVYGHFDAAMESFLQLGLELLPLLERPWDFLIHKGRRTKEMREIADRHELEFRQARRQFIDDAQTLVGSRLQ